MKISIIDDEKMSRIVLKNAIRRVTPDAEISLFPDGEEALSIIGSDRPDLVFLDINMADNMGISIADKIRALYPQISLIFETGYSEYRDFVVNRFHCGYLMKPVTARDVREEMKKQGLI